MKKIKRLFSIILSIAMIISSLSGCGNNNTGSKESAAVPDVSVSVVDDIEQKYEDLSDVADGTDSNIYTMVYNAVDYDLKERGYTTLESVAFSSDEAYSASGIGYYIPEFDLFDNQEYEALGFVTIIGNDDEYQTVPETCEYIAVEPIEGCFNEEASYNLLAYTCESIGYNHFVYQNQYVIYYQLDSTTVRYETYENHRDNYDLTLGSLYDFDNDTYIYDAGLFDGYETHSAEELFSEEDYAELQKELQLISEAQEKNGYYVEEINIVYISPESIQAYLESEEEDTFFGFSVAELESSLGAGTALVYTEEGFETAEYFEANSEDYNWKSFLTKVGIGAGIILVGAVLTPITGGASFGCALVTITKVSVGMALTQGLGTLAIETATGMMNGQSFEEALKNASHEGLDAFANGFMIGAVVGSVGVVSGVIKPVACFAAGTMIAVPGTTSDAVVYKDIKDIKAGDLVFAYDEIGDRTEINTVTGVFERETTMVVEVTINGEVIVTTEEHPFYTDRGWVSASMLQAGDSLQQLDGTFVVVEQVVNRSLEKAIVVYNFEVADNHTYYVGDESVLVHNKCDSVIKNARRKGVEKAWAKEVKAVKEGNSKYNWTRKEIKELLSRGKVQGYDGCHIVDVQANPNLAANPENIIFLKRSVHVNVVHGGNTNNLSHWSEIIKIMPQFEEQILAIGGLL